MFICGFFFSRDGKLRVFSPQWKLWFFLIFPLVKYDSSGTHKNGSQMHKHIRSVFLELLLGKSVCQREPSAPHSSFLQRCLNKIRLQAPFIVPHRKTSNFLKNDHSLHSTSPCKYNPDTSKVHQLTLYRAKTLQLDHKKLAGSTETRHPKYQGAGSSH